MGRSGAHSDYHFVRFGPAVIYTADNMYSLLLIPFCSWSPHGPSPPSRPHPPPPQPRNWRPRAQRCGSSSQTRATACLASTYLSTPLKPPTPPPPHQPPHPPPRRSHSPASLPPPHTAPRNLHPSTPHRWRFTPSLHSRRQRLAVRRKSLLHFRTCLSCYSCDPRTHPF